MARALDLLTSLVPVAGAAFYAIDRPVGRGTSGPLLMKRGQQDASDYRELDHERLLREYFIRYHKLDPFDPRRHAATKTPVVGVAEVGGPAAFARTPWAEYLAAWGVATETVMFLREEGRITAALSLTRTREVPDLDARELLVLHRCHPLIEDAWTLAQHEPPLLEHESLLAGRGLTGREAEVARRAAAGALTEEIARALIISPNTVKTHLKRAYAKLGVRNRTQLARLLGPGTRS
jgi:DNA-binding CsgD family transcriptional regulator